MSPLRPQRFGALLGRALAELEQRGSIFDLPRRSFWRGREGLDLSVDLHGERAATPLGPAAGPHTQMAQNLTMGWLAGGRAFELKTVQRNDRIEVPRPSIDAATVGYNVEWSQELPIEQSLEQYAIGWFLIHVLAARGVTGAAGGGAGAVFHASVGYDLDGIRSPAVARFLDALRDAGPLLARLRDGLPHLLRHHADVPVPERIVSCVTLSTFHGCPPEDIERIAEHLLARHGVHVIVKLNPTLLGFETVASLLHDRLGYRDIALDRDAFAHDPPWAEAVAMFERLRGTAARHGLTVGAKLTNTLMVRGPGGRLDAPVVYLSGAPLHVLAITLAERFARATRGHVPMAFSAGIDADNFHEAVACGLSPVTTCTDLLHPTGYRRMPRYLRRLEDEMVARGVRDIAGYVATGDLSARAAQVPGEPRYHAERNRTPPVRIDRALALLDCDSCNACLVACPNDAFFSLPIGAGSRDAPDLVIEQGRVRERSARFELARERQWAVFADLCNECGNCETFCPERGAPHEVKPRFHGSRESFDADGRDGILIEAPGNDVIARIAGRRYDLVRGAHGARFSDGVIAAELDDEGRLVAARAIRRREGHVLPLRRFHALRALADAVCAGVNPVTAGWLCPPPADPADRPEHPPAGADASSQGSCSPSPTGPSS